jgi:hypothetical protein
MKQELRFEGVTGCGCKPGKLFVDEQTFPIFTSDPDEAAREFKAFYRSGKLYWAVHLNGRHLVNVCVDGQWVVALGHGSNT